MFVIRIKTVGFSVISDGLIGDRCFTLGEYETFDKARRVVENEVASVLSRPDRYVIDKCIVQFSTYIERSGSQDKATVHKHVRVDDYDFDVDCVYEVLQEDSLSS